MKISNFTHWGGEALRQLTERAALLVFKGQPPTMDVLRVIIRYRESNTPRCNGGTLYKNTITVYVSKLFFDAEDYAHRVAHECGHLSALTDIGMEDNPVLGFRVGWRKEFQWANDYHVKAVEREQDAANSTDLERVVNRINKTLQDIKAKQAYLSRLRARARELKELEVAQAKKEKAKEKATAKTATRSKQGQAKKSKTKKVKGEDHGARTRG